MRLATGMILAAGALTAPGPGAAVAQDHTPGEKLALFHCGRCHVVNEKNRMGGIGSTPSFAVMRGQHDFEAKMRSFHALRPHPAFTRIPGVTAPFPENRPSPIHPVDLTEADLDRIVSYALTLEPADLGRPLGTR